MTRRILFFPPESLARDILSRKARAILESCGDVIWNDSGQNYTKEQVIELLPGAQAVVTSWGSPVFDEAMLAVADRLEVVGHAAGSVKRLMPQAGYERGIRVLSGAAIIADSVAEYTLWAMLSGQRNMARYDQVMKVDKGWGTAGGGYGHEVYGKTVGIIAASMVGRRVIKLLAPFGCDVLVYDPYLSEEGAEALGVRRVSLLELFAESDIVSVHAPTTPETKDMIGAEHFDAMKRGALFVNTARCWVIQRDPMLRTLALGKIRAYLDVFHKEPLAEDDPLRGMENVFLSPHVSGHTEESRARLVWAVASDIQRHFAGEPLQYAVSWERLRIMA